LSNHSDFQKHHSNQLLASPHQIMLVFIHSTTSRADRRQHLPLLLMNNLSSSPKMACFHPSVGALRLPAPAPKPSTWICCTLTASMRSATTTTPSLRLSTLAPSLKTFALRSVTRLIFKSSSEISLSRFAGSPSATRLNIVAKMHAGSWGSMPTPAASISSPGSSGVSTSPPCSRRTWCTAPVSCVLVIGANEHPPTPPSTSACLWSLVVPLLYPLLPLLLVKSKEPGKKRPPCRVRSFLFALLLLRILRIFIFLFFRCLLNVAYKNA
ncbi:hypothetical protein KCU64_g13, partial [Aureobasidium melanogenum]